MRLLYLIATLAISINVSAQDSVFTFIFLNKNPNAEQLTKEQSTQIMEGHMANINRLAKEGKLLAAGPFEGGGGIFVFKKASSEEIAEWLSPDPGVQAKRWNIEQHNYRPRVNGVCPVSEPYEMVMYYFIRFDAIVSKYTAGTYPQIIKKHDDYLKQIVDTGNVVTEGVFGDNDGGILIMRGDVDRSVFESDPGVQEGLINLTIKQLYIAKGSFCEK
ncbi:MAG TPA: YciI family protein [Chryseosolibacter sp.]|nr:YciI family protein [Chryseosolibacter sp.]